MGQEQGGYIDGDSGPEFTYGYGGGGDEFAIDYAADYGGAQSYAGDYGGLDEYAFYGFDFGTGAEYGGSGYTPGGGNEPIPYAPYEQSWEIEEFVPLAEIISTSEPGYAPYEQSWQIEEPQYFPLPVPPIDYAPYQQLWPIEEPQYFPLPVPPLLPAPATQQPNLPPACLGGQYHPYPIGHPQQNICIPFPPAQVSKSPAPVPGTTAPSGGGTSTSKPPAQQQKPPQQPKCPTGYFPDPATGQCKPIPQGQPQSCATGYYRASNGQCLPIPKCTTPGTVFDQARGLCVPQGQAISPLPEGVEGLFDELSNLPWWIWLALGGLILLNRDEDGKRATVTYRRAH